MTTQPQPLTAIEWAEEAAELVNALDEVVHDHEQAADLAVFYGTVLASASLVIGGELELSRDLVVQLALLADGLRQYVEERQAFRRLMDGDQ